MTSIRIMAAHGPIVVGLWSAGTTVVLSIGRLGVASGADYYLDTVANSVDDYYLGRGEAPGQWIGATSADLGLTGVVDPVALRNLLDGRGADGEDLGIMRRADRRPGFDLTFSAPKGLSLLWAFGSPEVRDAVSSAHDRAIVGVIDHLLREAAYVRRGVDGKQLDKADGFVAAGFRHRTSRAGDPQLHTHVLIPNIVCGIDGRWSAPDARQLLPVAEGSDRHVPLGTSGRVGAPRSVLAGRAQQPGGVVRHPEGRPTGVLEAPGRHRSLPGQDGPRVSKGGRSGCSCHPQSQAESCRAHRRASPGVGGPARERFGHRRNRDDQSSDAHRYHRCARRRPGALVFRSTSARRSWPLSPESDRWTWPTTTFQTQQAPGWHRSLCLPRPSPHRDAVAAVARAFDASPADVARLTEQLLQREGVLRMVDSDGRQPDVTGRGRERRASTLGDRRYTTIEMLKVEGRIVNSAVRRVGRSAAQVNWRTIDQVLATHSKLDGEQAAGVRKLLGSGNGLDVVIGQAGTGKSTMLGAARAGWEAASYEVIGTAIASRTAADLQAGTGIDSVTMAQLFIDLERGHTRLTPRHVVVVDEASMVGSRTLDRLQRQVDRARAKLVLVGDNRQLLLDRRRWGPAGTVEHLGVPRHRADHQPSPGTGRPGVGTPGPRPAAQW